MYLKRFQNDWATGEIVRQFINGRRKYEVRKTKNAKRDDDEAGPEDEDTSEDEQSQEDDESDE
jgi:hypothetical protein